MMHLTMVISSLACGGAERVLSTMANWFAAKGWLVSLLTFDDGTAPFYDLHPAVIWRPLGMDGISGCRIRQPRRNIRRVRALRRAIVASQPQALISFVDRTNVLALAATRGLGIPVIISERLSPKHAPINGPGWTILRRMLYPRATCLVLQTHASLRDYSPSMRSIARVIPNPVIPTSGAAGSIDEGTTPLFPGPLIVAMGRLHEQKGFDLLFQAFAETSARHPDWSLVIWGEGRARSSLESLRDRLGLQERAHLPGVTGDPAARMAEAEIFVLSSRYEGFPNVLCEAMAAGLPVVSFDCPFGPGEIVRHEVDGLLVPAGDASALAGALDRMMSDRDLRQRLVANLPDVAQRLSQERVMALWEDVIERAIQDAMSPRRDALWQHASSRLLDR